MANKRHNPEEIVTKLRQVDVLVEQGIARIDAIREVCIVDGSYQPEFNYYKISPSNPKCSGRILPSPFVVKDSKISGTLRHYKHGAISMSGEVAVDGSI
jgi:hypothetical protein